MTNAEFIIRKNGYTPASLSREIGVSPCTIYRWMRGECEPKREIKNILVAKLGCSMDDVVNVRDLD